ncbi:MAG: hypothetical protein ACYDBW_09300 [Sulfuricaulis sp.]
MSFAAQALRKGVRRVLLFQALLTLTVAAAFGYARGRHDFMSAGYGGALVMLLSAWLGRGALRSAGLGGLYANAVTRYAAAVVLLGLGMGVLKLAPLPLIVAFAVAQFGFLANVHRS